jgi:hypothetical protein
LNKPTSVASNRKIALGKMLSRTVEMGCKIEMNDAEFTQLNLILVVLSNQLVQSALSAAI